MIKKPFTEAAKKEINGTQLEVSNISLIDHNYDLEEIQEDQDQKYDTVNSQRSNKMLKNFKIQFLDNNQLVLQQRNFSLSLGNPQLYEEETLKKLSKCEADLELIKEIQHCHDHSILDKLKTMRKENTIAETRRYRITGILPEIIVKHHITDSITPGDGFAFQTEQDTAPHGHDHNEDGIDHHAINFQDLFILKEYSTFTKIRKGIHLMACITTPYYYAWIALNGYEKEEKSYMITTIIFEFMFASHILFNFLTEYVPDGEIVPIRELEVIGNRYLSSEFLVDFIPTFPITFFLNNSNKTYWRLFFLIKIMRLHKGIKVYDVEKMMDILRKVNKKQVMKKIENDPSLIENLDLDLNNIDLLFSVRYLLKIFRLFLMIVNVAYFTGVIWMIGCQITARSARQNTESEQLYFYDEYEIGNESNLRTAIISLYYSFTTLSTIGFGDFHPKSNFERIFCAIIMVGGVMVFSLFMGNFVDMIKEYQTLKSEIGDFENLSKFFGLMKKFNKGKDIKTDLRNKIEAYFTFRWLENKMQALDDEDEMSLLDQLPFHVQDQLFSHYIFNKFVHDFTMFFKIQKPRVAGQDLNYGRLSLKYIGENFTWNDENYRNFMMSALKCLEPICFEQGSYIQRELEEFGEINFIQQGDIHIGFEINRNEQFPLKCNKCAIGSFGVTFKMRSQFIYKAATYCQGFFIRKEYWHELLEEQDSYICITMKQNILVDFILKVRSKLMVLKKKAYEKFKSRSDYHNMLIVDNKDKDEVSALLRQLFSREPGQNQEKTLIEDFRNKITIYQKYSSSQLSTIDDLVSSSIKKDKRIKLLQEQVDILTERLIMNNLPEEIDDDDENSSKPYDQ